jgi:hypothetical protein
VHEQQFSVALECEDAWETLLVVENETMGETMIVIIDYCKFCIKFKTFSLG